MTADEATRIVMSHRLLRRYVLPGERVVLAARWHWAKLVEPAVTAFLVLCLCAWLSLALEPALGDDAVLVWWLWFAALARFGWCLLVWRVEWFVATDKRMLLLTGLVTHQVGMMPLMKVTDMRYSRSVLGQMLGYGQFLLESAGQDQALRQIDWVAHPDATYRDLCALIFTPDEAPPSDGEDDAGPVERAEPRSRPGTTPTELTPPALVPTHGGEHEDGEDDEDDEDEYEPGDTQPIPVPPRTPAPGRAGTAERRTVDEHGAARGADDDEPAWYVSEPTARFVDLASRATDRGDGQPG